jgi:dTDP-4-amino-4,6-dideoxygalactose transaminase
LAGSGIATPTSPPHARHVYHIYAIRSPERNAWQDALAARGIQTGIHYPIPVHLQPAFADLGCGRGEFPHAERAAHEVLSLPMFAELTPMQREQVADALLELVAPPPYAATARAA